MRIQQTIRVQVSPQNPVQYLACCGLFEIASRFDTEATSRWITTNAHTEFTIETLIDESSLMNCVVRTFTDWTCWSPEPAIGEDINCFAVSFDLGSECRTLHLDWWYETLNRNGEIRKKGAWKMYAGNQKVFGISQDMVRAAKETANSDPPKKLIDLIGLHQGMTGRFGFDPRSSRNALDAGFSANDLNLPIPTYPFSEILAVIGAQHFFPHRSRQSGGNESTRGWIEKTTFQYGLWTIRLPVALARVAAACAAFQDEAKIIPMHSVRASRDKYSNLTMASMATLRREAK